MLLLASASSLAHAHGEEILVTVYAELASIAICAMVVLSWHRAVSHRVIGLMACLVSVIVGNWAVSDLPYMQYRNLITAVGFIAPLAATISAIYVSHHLASREKQQR
jgi:hypothetical protein